MAWDKRHQGTDLSWVYQKLVQRWGDAALLRLGVTPAYVKQGLHRVMLGLGGTQTGAGNLAPTTLGKDAAAAVLARPERSYSLAACTS